VNRAPAIRIQADQTIASKAGVSNTVEGGVSVNIKGPVVKLN
jgi:hypothetical protein